MATAPKQTAEGRLLDDALLRRRWKAPRLASETSVSVDWVRAILRGYRNTGAGTFAPVVPDAAMLATLAKPLGVTVSQLSGIGRPDAARALGILNGTDEPTPEEPSAAPELGERLARIRDELDRLISELPS